MGSLREPKNEPMFGSFCSSSKSYKKGFEPCLCFNRARIKPVGLCLSFGRLECLLWFLPMVCVWLGVQRARRKTGGRNRLRCIGMRLKYHCWLLSSPKNGRNTKGAFRVVVGSVTGILYHVEERAVHFTQLGSHPKIRIVQDPCRNRRFLIRLNKP